MSMVSQVGILDVAYQCHFRLFSLRNHGILTTRFHSFHFIEITMYETLMRPHEVTQIPSLKSVRRVGEELKGMAVRREERRLRQIASSAASRAKRKREEAGDELDSGEVLEDSSLKRVKTGEGEGGETSTTNVGAEIRIDDDDYDDGVKTNASTNLNVATDPEVATVPIEYSDRLAGESVRPSRGVGSADTNGSNSIGGDSGSGGHLNVSRIFPEVRGHTSYLTFACLVPFPSDATARESIE